MKEVEEEKRRKGIGKRIQINKKENILEKENERSNIEIKEKKKKENKLQESIMIEE